METFIRSRYFITSFPFGSSLQPRLLITFNDINCKQRCQYLDFFSSSSSATSFISRLKCPFPVSDKHKEYLPQIANGLISLGFGEEKIIFNPTTGKSITLPKVITRRKIVQIYFRYDPVNDQYKVLCMRERLYDNRNFQTSHHRVYTFGARESWRVMDCSIPHRPWSNGLCIDVVLYYVAFTGKGMLQRSLMRFDLRSEKMDLFTRLPANLNAGTYILIKYEGKVALMAKFPLAYIFDVRVMEERGWLKKSFSVEPYCKSLGPCLQIKGTTHMGEIILAPYHATRAFYVVFYNPHTN